ncbi:hypothetical protein M405DRAFT_804296 [Rhizopogon salebrosus TDB-379]|nr:hypothetical protein M405DRAFT_804296 [Rhizopogon salebrosus TDB-379]
MIHEINDIGTALAGDAVERHITSIAAASVGFTSAGREHDMELTHPSSIDLTSSTTAPL